MKCVAISDTHSMYRGLIIPAGDVLLHAGDITGRGKTKEIHEFNDWLGTLPHKHKIVIAGNHDWCFYYNEQECREILTNAIYLQDESVTIDGVKFYGSPWQPEFCNWAFNLPRGQKLKEKWDMIPDDTDVLITHGPAYMKLDYCEGGNVGCEELAKAVLRVKPEVHLFGHIHEGYGMSLEDGITYINASVCTGAYKPTNKPIVFDMLGE